MNTQIKTNRVKIEISIRNTGKYHRWTWYTWQSLSDNLTVHIGNICIDIGLIVLPKGTVFQ